MAGDDDYEPALGVDDAEPAFDPSQTDRGTDDDGGSDSFEAGSGDVAEIVSRHRTTNPINAKTREAMKEAAAAFKAAKAANPEDDEGDFGEFDETPNGAPVAKQGAKVAPTEIAKAAVAAAEQAPPAPSLDPEVSRMRAQLAADREAVAKELDAARKQRETSTGVVNHEDYLESSPSAYRKWIESMRGTPMTDDEFRNETADFVTILSGEVLGVKLPDEVKSRIDSQNAKKAFKAFKDGMTRKEQAEASKRETEYIQRQWDEAKQSIDVQFRDTSTDKVTGKTTAETFAYLAAEDSPGAIVIDVIQFALKRDGTKLSWVEASKKANDYLKTQTSAYIDKRKHLLSVAPTEKTVGDPSIGKANGAPRERPPGIKTQQVTRTPAPEDPSAPPVVTRHRPGSTWDKEAHRRQTRSAFASVFKPEE